MKRTSYMLRALLMVYLFALFILLATENYGNVARGESVIETVANPWRCGEYISNKLLMRTHATNRIRKVSLMMNSNASGMWIGGLLNLWIPSMKAEMGTSDADYASVSKHVVIRRSNGLAALWGDPAYINGHHNYLVKMFFQLSTARLPQLCCRHMQLTLMRPHDEDENKNMKRWWLWRWGSIRVENMNRRQLNV